MMIWGIADIHASRTDPLTGAPEKPMDVFGPRWTNHMERLERAWMGAVAPGDTVIVAGDIDWGLRLHDARETLVRIDRWPGCKILLRGNHDYWWSSKSTSRVRQALPSGMRALHNDAIEVDGFNVCGTKGSPVPGASDWTADDEKLLRREVQRLALSLEARAPHLPTLVALHYPPFYGPEGESPYREAIEAAGVRCVIYGHLHGEAAASGPSGTLRGVDYRLVAGDATGFRPTPIARAGELLEPGRGRTGASLS